MFRRLGNRRGIAECLAGLAGLKAQQGQTEWGAILLSAAESLLKAKGNAWWPADRVMRSAMSKLFREEPDVREVIKLKAIYELLETITDKCEDVANLIEGVVLENS